MTTTNQKTWLITGVAEGYYKGVFDRNPHLINSSLSGGMPYGGEPADHDAVDKLGLSPYLLEGILNILATQSPIGQSGNTIIAVGDALAREKHLKTGKGREFLRDIFSASLIPAQITFSNLSE